MAKISKGGKNAKKEARNSKAVDAKRAKFFWVTLCGSLAAMVTSVLLSQILTADDGSKAQVLNLRLDNMKKYNYSYDVWGIDRRNNLSLEEYYDVYDGKWPVLIQGVVSQWEAFNWSKNFFMTKYGKERVAMKAVDRSLEHAVSLALPLEMFINHTDDAFPTRWTYVEDELFLPTRPELKKQIGRNVYLDEDFFQLFPEYVRPWNAMLLWGTRYSRSSLHLDPYNWTGTNAVLKGLKKWKLFPPGQDHLLYVASGKKSGFPLDCYKYNSPIDGFDPDLEKYPLYTQSRVVEFDQQPGELLLIPTGWLHQAFNDKETIAISSQVMNRNNYRIVLEEVIKVGNVQRGDLPPNIDGLKPKEITAAVMKLLPKSVIRRGRAVTEDALKQVREETLRTTHWQDDVT